MTQTMKSRPYPPITVMIENEKFEVSAEAAKRIDLLIDENFALKDNIIVLQAEVADFRLASRVYLTLLVIMLVAAVIWA